MRALIFASVLGSARSTFTLIDEGSPTYFGSSCTHGYYAEHYPGTLTGAPSDLDTYFNKNPLILKGSEDICEDYKACNHWSSQDCVWENNECTYTGTGAETTSTPCSSFKGAPDKGFENCPQVINPLEAMVVDDSVEYAVNSYRTKLDVLRTSWAGFIATLTDLSSSTGIYSDHAIIVKEYTDYMRQIAAYADAVATGAVKSPKQLKSVTNECINYKDASGITLNQTVFDEWKLGPFDTAPEVGVNAGNCTALETAYRGNCGCGSA